MINNGFKNCMSQHIWKTKWRTCRLKFFEIICTKTELCHKSSKNLTTFYITWLILQALSNLKFSMSNLALKWLVTLLFDVQQTDAEDIYINLQYADIKMVVFSINSSTCFDRKTTVFSWSSLFSQERASFGHFFENIEYYNCQHGRPLLSILW